MDEKGPGEISGSFIGNAHLLGNLYVTNLNKLLQIFLLEVTYLLLL